MAVAGRPDAARRQALIQAQSFQWTAILACRHRRGLGLCRSEVL